MVNTRRGPIPDELGWLIDLLDDHSERLRTLEAPSGEALRKTVATLSALVIDIQAQLDDYIAGKYTNGEIDARIANAIAAALAGNISIGGNLTVAGAVTMLGARATNLASAPSRVTTWIAGDWRVGHT